MDRRDETSGLSAAPSESVLREKTGPTAEVRPLPSDERPPPRPLPPRAFIEAAPSAHEDASSVNSSDGAGLLPPEAAFSEIAAEASARSQSAVETAIASALAEIKPHKPIEISEISLPAGSSTAESDLGGMVPRRMLEPRLELGPPPSFDALRIDAPTYPDRPQQPLKDDFRPASGPWPIAKRVVRVLAWVAVGWLTLVLALIVAYRFVNPPASMLMLQYWLSGESVTQKWVPFEQISPNVVRAVVLSEDGRFCQHSGIDFEAIEDAIENTDGRSRGGSTISMQVVKNLFLWPSKSYIRKAIELPLTVVMELVWSKRRIIEVYLNIAQWGPGIFGIGAAADYHFHKTARALSVRDAARLAVSLPNPLVRDAGHPGPGLQRLANAILVRMRLAPSSQLSCVLPRRRF
ncbi:MAG: monofunctional biosynthetic peptidoglycan transglycosylase [Proteobacteria bacterium]|nr:monofunctional biosynthetic peptidoglycan transglycosylase [Pseudomonadota bacterium]